MTSRIGIAWALVSAASLALVIPATVRYRHATAALLSSSAAGDAGQRLRVEASAVAHSLPAWARSPARHDAEPALAQTFAAAVTAAGLAPTAVEAFTPSTSTVIEAVPGLKGGPTVLRGRASAALDAVTLPQLGRLLDAWHTAAPGWTVTQIDLTPLRLTPADATRYAGSDLPLRVGVTIERLWATGVVPITRRSSVPDDPAPSPKDHPR